MTAVLNLPLIENKLAVRGVVYNDYRGGYIDNVPGTFTRKDTDVGIHYAELRDRLRNGAPPAACVPAEAIDRLRRPAGQSRAEQQCHRRSEPSIR